MTIQKLAACDHREVKVVFPENLLDGCPICSDQKQIESLLIKNKELKAMIKELVNECVNLIEWYANSCEQPFKVSQVIQNVKAKIKEEENAN